MSASINQPRAAADVQPRETVKRTVTAQVRRDMLIFAGFIAAGFILSVNLDVVGLLYAVGAEYEHLQLSKFFGTIIFTCTGLTLYVMTRYSAHIRELRTRLQTEERARRVYARSADRLAEPPPSQGVLTGCSAGMTALSGLAWSCSTHRFKSFNDARVQGDEVLMNVGKILNLRAGVDGFVARLESDEFVILLPDQGEEELMDWLSAVLTAIKRHACRQGNRQRNRSAASAHRWPRCGNLAASFQPRPAPRQGRQPRLVRVLQDRHG
jgi:hypothetical protein